jgi:hypothetical protein
MDVEKHEANVKPRITMKACYHKDEHDSLPTWRAKLQGNANPARPAGEGCLAL